jgi:hypothetical protein
VAEALEGLSAAMTERRTPSLMIVLDLESDGPVVIPVCDNFDDEVRLAWNIDRLLDRESIDDAVLRWLEPLLDREAA